MFEHGAMKWGVRRWNASYLFGTYDGIYFHLHTAGGCRENFNKCHLQTKSIAQSATC